MVMDEERAALAKLMAHPQEQSHDSLQDAQKGSLRECQEMCSLHCKPFGFTKQLLGQIQSGHLSCPQSCKSKLSSRT